MNFDPMWSVQANSDVLCVPSTFLACQILNTSMLYRSFWYIAIPVMAVVVPIALWSDVKKMVHYLQKRVATKNAVKVSAIDLRVDFDLEFSILADLQAGLIVDSLPPSLPPVLHPRCPFSVFLLYHPRP